ncbi:MAG: hypothetical protein GY822_04610 [Deltaproteobacteria bacterium]|nr:hypothetical protein [Deltaproteobacteria bacterium]
MVCTLISSSFFSSDRRNPLKKTRRKKTSAFLLLFSLVGLHLGSSPSAQVQSVYKYEDFRLRASVSPVSNGLFTEEACTLVDCKKARNKEWRWSLFVRPQLSYAYDPLVIRNLETGAVAASLVENQLILDAPIAFVEGHMEDSPF